MQTGGLYPQRRQEWCRDRGGLHSANHDGHAAGAAGHQAFAANRPPGRGGVQAAESELRNGRQGENAAERTANYQTAGHIGSSDKLQATPVVGRQVAQPE